MTSKIREFYKDCNILITGGMGFLGKILIQKLLRECGEIKGIYLLVRAKRGKDINTRMEEVFQDIVFKKLREYNKDFTEKIYLIEGDCSKLDLGLSEENRNMIIENINIVFHMAASLNMDSNLRDAVEINVRGIREMIKLCHEMKELKAFITVSTAYSNCNNLTIEEQFYKPKLSGECLISLVEELDDRTLDQLTPTLLDDMPNTYVYTKCAAEDLIYKNGKGLPLAIFRPSIVQPTYQDPLPGWTDNYYGPTGIAVAVFHGIIRFAYCNKYKRVNIIPVDYCANALISSAWDLQLRITETEEKYPIYNFATTMKNTLSWNEYGIRLLHWNDKIPMMNTMWPSHCYYVTKPIYYFFCAAIFHYIPALLTDGFLFVTGNKVKMVPMYKKLHKLIFILEYFAFHEFYFKNDNVCRMWDNLNEDDQVKFPFDLNSLDWDEYCKHVYNGVKFYLVKDHHKDIPQAIRRYRWLQLFEKILLISVIVIVILTILKIFL